MVLAFGARLVPVVRGGGGLRGLVGYDDAVYYDDAVALVHGVLPYRDLLLLHPPGSVLALEPFAALGSQTSEMTGLAFARVGRMIMGATTAVIVTRMLRPISVGAALVGGCSYALYPPAVQVEQVTLLEGLSNPCIAGAVLLVGRRSSKPLVMVRLPLGQCSALRLR